MVQRKKTEKEKNIVKIKATTGAWWKSTTAEEQKEEPPKKKRKPAPKKPPHSRKSSVEKTQKKKSETEPVAPAESTEAVQEEGEVKQRKGPQKRGGAPKRKSPRKTTRQAGKSTARKSPKVSAKKEKEKIDEPEAVDDTQPAETAENKQVVEAEKPTRGRKQRGRRPKRKKKESAEVETEKDETVEAEEAPEQTLVEGDETAAGEDGVAGEGEPAKEDAAQKEAEQEAVEEEVKEPKKVCKLLINAEEPEECRLALLEDGRLESIHVSTVSQTQRKNNIYKAKIVAIEPSLQAAFVDYGTEKNGFLPFSEIHPEYYKQELSENVKKLVEGQQWKKLKITDVIEKGQEILAQVVKEEIGKKGANMTTYLSIPGRCVVLMPGSDSAGISRKISGESRRSQLREAMESIDMPEGIGWIVRTASVDITKNALSRDVDYLLKLWADIKSRGQTMDGVGLIYEDHHSVLRFLREHFDPSIQEILVDDKDALDQVKSFISLLPKAQQDVKVRLHQGARPIFNQYSVEDQIESIYQPQVNLPSGGSIVIDPTEALVAIDVNSGSTSKGKNFEQSIFQANLEAAAELARQLRLRDLGGLIVVDFIDMRSKKNILAVEKQVKASMKKDKAKVDFTRISKFGLMQISRQKLGAPIEAGNYRRCEHCKGRGTVRSVETLSLFYLRRIQTGASRKPVERIECRFPLEVASYLLNKKRNELSEMEGKYHVEILINGVAGMRPSENDILFHKVEKEKKS